MEGNEKMSKSYSTLQRKNIEKMTRNHSYMYILYNEVNEFEIWEILNILMIYETKINQHT